MAGSRRKSVIWDTISILIEATVVLHGRFVTPPERRGSTSSYSHIIIPAVIVESSVSPSTDRSHDGARGDNNSARSNNNSTWGDNDRACSDAARNAGRADDGACFRCSGVKSVGIALTFGDCEAAQERHRRGEVLVGYDGW